MISYIFKNSSFFKGQIPQLPPLAVVFDFIVAILVSRAAALGLVSLINANGYITPCKYVYIALTPILISVALYFKLKQIYNKTNKNDDMKIFYGCCIASIYLSSVIVIAHVEALQFESMSLYYMFIIRSVLSTLMILPVGIWLIWSCTYRLNILHGIAHGKSNTPIFMAMLTAITVIAGLSISNFFGSMSIYGADKIYDMTQESLHQLDIIKIAKDLRAVGEGNSDRKKLQDNVIQTLEISKQNYLRLDTDIDAFLITNKIASAELLATTEVVKATRQDLISKLDVNLKIQNNIGSVEEIGNFVSAVQRQSEILSSLATGTTFHYSNLSSVLVVISTLVLLSVVFTLVFPVSGIVSDQHSSAIVARDKAIKTLNDLQAYEQALDKYFGVVVTDVDGTITYANSRFYELSGHSVEETIGNTNCLVNSGHHPKSFFKDMWQTILAGKTWHGEICNRSKSGAYYWIDTIVFPLLNTDGKTDRFVSIRTDITEIKNAEQKLARANAILEAFVKHAPASVAMLDRNMDYIAHTDEFVMDYAIPYQSVVGMNHYEVFPRTPARRRDFHSRCLAGEVIRLDEEQIELRDGSIGIHYWEGRPWKYADGSIGGIVILTENISERREAEETLRASEERFRSLFLFAPLGVALRDLETGEFVLTNDAMSGVSGYSASELRDMRFEDLIEDVSGKDKDRSASRNLGRYETEERELLRKDGKTIPVLISGVTLRDHDGRKMSLEMVQEVAKKRNFDNRSWHISHLESFSIYANDQTEENTLHAIATANTVGHSSTKHILELDKPKNPNKVA